MLTVSCYLIISVFVIIDQVSGSERYRLVLQCSDEESYAATQPAFAFIYFSLFLYFELSSSHFKYTTAFVIIHFDWNGLVRSLQLHSTLPLRALSLMNLILLQHPLKIRIHRADIRFRIMTSQH